MNNYVPDRGDIIWTSFSPQAGHEQAGKRPALVLSPKRYNDMTGLLVGCPITRQSKGYIFEVQLPTGLGIEGAVLADHLKSIDWRARGAELIGRVKTEIVLEAVAKINRLLEG